MSDDELLAEIRDAADDLREASERHRDAVTEAIVCGISMEQIREAEGRLPL